ncbi:MAG: hypothetical protein HW387_590 [Parachlamydiales bacterium]|nr:hypothetical protein [Parachlamydiales bacterium]
MSTPINNTPPHTPIAVTPFRASWTSEAQQTIPRSVFASAVSTPPHTPIGNTPIYASQTLEKQQTIPHSLFRNTGLTSPCTPDDARPSRSPLKRLRNNTDLPFCLPDDEVSFSPSPKLEDRAPESSFTYYTPRYPVTLDFSRCPRKPKRLGYIAFEKIHSRFNRNAVLLQQDTNLAIQSFEGKHIALTVNERVMTGQHCVVARIAPDQPPVIDGRSNEEILLKTFRDYCIMVIGDDNVHISPDASTNVLNQYDQMNAAGIPVMEIYNYEQALNGCGYFLVEYVPTPFQMPWARGDDPNTMDVHQKAVLDNVRRLIEDAYRNGIYADLQPNNLRYRADGTLVFTDLREDRPDYDIYLLGMFQKMALTFNCDKDDAIYRYLTKNLTPMAANSSAVYE